MDFLLLHLALSRLNKLLLLRRVLHMAFHCYECNWSISLANDLMETSGYIRGNNLSEIYTNPAIRRLSELALHRSMVVLELYPARISPPIIFHFFILL